MPQTPFAAIAGLAALTGVLDGLARATADTLFTDVGSTIADDAVQMARLKLGIQQPGWPALAEATQADREARGYPPNEPLLREGALHDSITWDFAAEGDPYEATFLIGVPQGAPAADYAAVQELGSINLPHPIPPRPFLLPSVEDAIQNAAPLLQTKIRATAGYAPEGASGAMSPRQTMAALDVMNETDLSG